MKHAIDVDLPRASSTPQSTKAEVVVFSVNSQGQYFLNEAALDDAALAERFRALAAKEPQPELHIRGDSNVRYERVALALAAAQQAGLRKVAFITEPKAP
jgi:biopolymer transport protein ExbD